MIEFAIRKESASGFRSTRIPSSEAVRSIYVVDLAESGSMVLTLMSSVQEIQEALRQLPDEDLAAFRVWFVEFDASLWDRQFEADVSAGRLDQLAEEALRDVCDGHCTDL